MPSRLRTRSLLTAALLIAGCAAAATPSALPSLVTKTTIEHDIRVTLTLEGPPLTTARSFISASVENHGQRAVRWQGGGCNDPVNTFIDLAGVFERGRAWPGLLGRFKTLALGDGSANLTNVGYEEVSRLPVPGQIQIACTADLRVNELEPGKALRMRAAWDGTMGGVAPAPIGPATVTTYFPYIGVAGLVPDDLTDATSIAVRIETAVEAPPGGAAEGGAQAARLPLAPGLAIDAALGDPQFAAWVQAAPEAQWINPNVVLLEGAWHVGLFLFGPNHLERFGEVTVAADGSIVARRFEP